MEDSSDDDWVGVVLERGRACNFNCIPFGDGANAEAVVVVLATAQSAADDDILKILDSCIAVDLLVFTLALFSSCCRASRVLLGGGLRAAFEAISRQVKC